MGVLQLDFPKVGFFPAKIQHYGCIFLDSQQFEMM